MAGDQDNPGINVPPPLIYLLPLVLGLLLDRRARLPFLPRGVARGLGWSLFGGGLALYDDSGVVGGLGVSATRPAPITMSLGGCATRSD